MLESLLKVKWKLERSRNGIHEKDNVYLTGGVSISIYNSKGERIENIMFPERTTNVTFAGKERKTLFVTASKSIYTLEMAVRGAPTPLDQAK